MLSTPTDNPGQQLFMITTTALGCSGGAAGDPQPRQPHSPDPSWLTISEFLCSQCFDLHVRALDATS